MMYGDAVGVEASSARTQLYWLIDCLEGNKLGPRQFLALGLEI